MEEPRKKFRPPIWSVLALGIGLGLVAAPMVLLGYDSEQKRQQLKNAPCVEFEAFPADKIPARCIEYFHGARDAGR